MLIITVHNRAGASATYSAKTRAGISGWLRTAWQDPENLTARVTEEGREVGHKPLDRKRIVWAKESK